MFCEELRIIAITESTVLFYLLAWWVFRRLPRQ
jgi:hypothetical protein